MKTREKGNEEEEEKFARRPYVACPNGLRIQEILGGRVTESEKVREKKKDDVFEKEKETILKECS